MEERRRKKNIIGLYIYKNMRERDTERERDRDREKDRERDRERQRDRDRQTDRVRGRERDRGRVHRTLLFLSTRLLAVLSRELNNDIFYRNEV